MHVLVFACTYIASTANTCHRCAHLNVPYKGGTCTFSDRALKLFRNLGQKSLKRGRSIFFRLCSVLASTLTYSWVTGTRFLWAQTGRWGSTLPCTHSNDTTNTRGITYTVTAGSSDISLMSSTASLGQSLVLQTQPLQPKVGTTLRLSLPEKQRGTAY